MGEKPGKQGGHSGVYPPVVADSGMSCPVRLQDGLGHLLRFQVVLVKPIRPAGKNVKKNKQSRRITQRLGKRPFMDGNQLRAIVRNFRLTIIRSPFPGYTP